MYIEDKSQGLEGEGRIGRVYFSHTRITAYYKGRTFQRVKGPRSKSNYADSETGEAFWISGPRKDENNRLHGGNAGVEIDEDVQEEYNQLIKAPKKT